MKVKALNCVLQLLSWSESPRGHRVVFEVMSDPSDPLLSNPFKPYTMRDKKIVGQLFAAALVEFDPSTDTAKEPPKQTFPAFTEACGKPQMKLSQIAAAMGKDAEFMAWCNRHGDAIVGSAEDVRQFILVECGIDSRSELDTNASAGSLFTSMREEFDTWRDEQHRVRL